MRKKVIILGGGVAGLSAAFHLLKNGDFTVKILEKTKTLGGLAISVSRNGVVSDLGPHRIYSQFKEVDKLLDEIKENTFIKVRRKSRMFLNGKFIKYPPTILSLFTDFGLTKISKFGYSYFKDKIRNFFLHQEDASYEGWMRKSFGNSLYEEILLPYSTKVWKMNPQELSADIARIRLAGGKSIKNFANCVVGWNKPKNLTALKEFDYIKGGIGKLSELLAEKVRCLGGETILNCNINHIQVTPGQIVESVISEMKEDSFGITGDYFISTIPVTELVSYLMEHKIAPTIKMINDSLRYISMICVFLVFDRERYSDNSWMYFPKEDIIFNRVYEAKNFDKELCPANKTVLCFEITDFETGGIWEMNDNDIIKRVIEDCNKMKMLQGINILDGFVHRISNAYPVYDLIYDVKLKKIWQYLAGFRNIITIGRQGLFNHNNVDHSIFMGIKAAEFLLDRFPDSQQWYSVIPQFENFKIVD